MTNFFYGVAAAGAFGILFFGSALDSVKWGLALAGVVVSAAVLMIGYRMAVELEDDDDV